MQIIFKNVDTHEVVDSIELTESNYYIKDGIQKKIYLKYANAFYGDQKLLRTFKVTAIVELTCPHCGDKFEHPVYNFIKRYYHGAGVRCCGKKCSNKFYGKERAAKAKATNMERYGVSTPLILTDNLKKSMAGRIKKYGSLSDMSKRNYKTFLKRNGYSSYNDHPEFRKGLKARSETLRKFSDERHHLWQQRRFATYRKNGTNFYAGPISKAQLEFYAELKAACEYDIELEYGFDVGGASRFVDFYVPELKIGIEYYGSYWHASPRIYDADQLLNLGGETSLVSDIWKRDAERIAAMLTDDDLIAVYVVWEDTYKQNVKEELDECLNFIKTHCS